MANSNFNYVNGNAVEWTLVSSGDQAADGDLIFTSLNSSKDYMLMVANSYATNADLFNITALFSTDNGSTYLSSYYNPFIEKSSIQYFASPGATGITSISIGASTVATGRFILIGLESGKYTGLEYNFVLSTGNSRKGLSRALVTTAVNAIKFTFSGIGGSGRTAYYWYSRDKVL